MEAVEHCIRNFYFIGNDQLTSGHYYRNNWFPSGSQFFDKLTLGSLQIQIGQGMCFTGKNRFFSDKYHHSIGLMGCTYRTSNTCRVLVTAIFESFFKEYLNLVAIHFFDGNQRCLCMFFFSVEYPGTHLLIGRICHRTDDGQCFYLIGKR